MAVPAILGDQPKADCGFCGSQYTTVSSDCFVTGDMDAAWHTCFEVDTSSPDWRNRAIVLFPGTDRGEAIIKVDVLDEHNTEVWVFIVPGKNLKIRQKGKRFITTFEDDRARAEVDVPLADAIDTDTLRAIIQRIVNTFWARCQSLLTDNLETKHPGSQAAANDPLIHQD